MATKKAKKLTSKHAQKAPTEDEAVVTLQRMQPKTMAITIIGDSSLIMHKWSEKAKKQMRDKQMKKAAKTKEAKDPKKLYEESMYQHPDGGYGFPAIGFKRAAVTACTQVSGITKVLARGAFHVEGEGNERLVKIEGKPNMREDMVRLAGGVADLRYRGEFKKWKAVLLVRFNPDAMSAEQIIALFDIAGFAVGVGEYRPEKNGDRGMFHVGGSDE